MPAPNSTPAPHDPRVPLGWKNGSATFMLSLAGLMMANLAPLIMSVLGELGFDIVESGNILTWALLASAVVGLGTARLAAGAHRRALAAAGLVVATLGFAVAAMLTGPAVVVASFIIGGAGVGTAIAASGAAIAAIRNPNRVSATSGVVNRVLVMIVLAIIPIIGLSQISVFGALAVLSLIGLVLAAWLPNAPDYAEPVEVTQSLKIAEPRRITIAGIVLLVLFPVWGASEDAVWTLTSVLGDNVGLDPAALGFALSAAAGGGAIAMIIVTVFGNRMGRAVPLVIALVLGGAVKMWIGLATDPSTLAALIIVVNTIYGFAFVLFLATAAGLDARGRWSAPLIGAYLVGSSFAPIIGAWIIDAVGIPTFGVLMGIVSFIAIVPAVWVARVSIGAEKALARQGATS
ncbi:MFS transporter [Leucobacter denitrificans]|uniref:MFS transporter n=1 Tax=Leucobacter denitrificans TaxID=683042 RepID=A0A7G9S7V9_9MICO|nr:MFS transporter [Leucobacter denitrificans]